MNLIKEIDEHLHNAHTRASEIVSAVDEIEKYFNTINEIVAHYGMSTWNDEKPKELDPIDKQRIDAAETALNVLLALRPVLATAMTAFEAALHGGKKYDFLPFRTAAHASR